MPIEYAEIILAVVALFAGILYLRVRRTRVFVVTGEELGAGLHSLEADISVAGVGSGRLVIEGTVPAG